ncbi:hypothetical protein ACHAWF_008687 [Thalassiosira exigua]
MVSLVAIFAAIAAASSHAEEVNDSKSFLRPTSPSPKGADADADYSSQYNLCSYRGQDSKALLRTNANGISGTDSESQRAIVQAVDAKNWRSLRAHIFHSTRRSSPNYLWRVVAGTVFPEFFFSDPIDLLFSALFGGSSGDSNIGSELDEMNKGIGALKKKVDDLEVKIDYQEFSNIYHDLLEHEGLGFIKNAGHNLAKLMSDPTIDMDTNFDINGSHTCLHSYVQNAERALVDNAMYSSPLNKYIEYIKTSYPATGLYGVRRDIVNLVRQISVMVGQALVVQSVLQGRFPKADFPFGEDMRQSVKKIIYHMWDYIGASYPTLDDKPAEHLLLPVTASKPARLPNHFFFKNMGGGSLSKYAWIDDIRDGWDIPLSEGRHEAMVKLSGQDVQTFLDWTFFQEPHKPRAYSDQSVQDYLKSEGLVTADIYGENLKLQAYSCVVGRSDPGMRQVITHEALYLDFTNGKIGKDEIIDYSCCDIQDKNHCSEWRDVWNNLEEKYASGGSRNYLRVLDMTNFYNNNTDLPALMDKDSIREERDGIVVNARRKLSDTHIELLVRSRPFKMNYWFRLVRGDGTPGPVIVYSKCSDSLALANPLGDDAALTIQAGYRIILERLKDPWGFIVKQSTTIINTTGVNRITINEGECFEDSDCEQGKPKPTCVEIERTGCCTWGVSDCSNWRPSDSPECQYLKEDCEGQDCGGTWQPFPKSCTDSKLGYQERYTDPWCNKNSPNCNHCGGDFMVVPWKRTGCCTFDGRDCSRLDIVRPECQYFREDCEEFVGCAGGAWQPFTDDPDRYPDDPDQYHSNQDISAETDVANQVVE